MVSPKDYLLYLKNSLLSSTETSSKNKSNILNEMDINVPGNQSNSSEKYMTSKYIYNK